MNLREAEVLVTGGSAGIGYAIAELALARGARVVINGRDPERLRIAADSLGVPAIPGDVGVEADASRIAAQAAEEMGSLNVLINNAGWGHRMPVAEIDAERFAAMWQTNVLGAALMARECLPYLKKSGGSIVNISSTAGRKGFAEGSAYVATKFALRGMSECWQAELRPHDIRVMIVNPSEVQTGFGGKDPDREMNPNKLLSEDIAHAVVSALELEDRGFIPELTVFATNPWKEE